MIFYHIQLLYLNSAGSFCSHLCICESIYVLGLIGMHTSLPFTCSMPFLSQRNEENSCSSTVVEIFIIQLWLLKLSNHVFYLKPYSPELWLEKNKWPIMVIDFMTLTFPQEQTSRLIYTCVFDQACNWMLFEWTFCWLHRDDSGIQGTKNDTFIRGSSSSFLGGKVFNWCLNYGCLSFFLFFQACNSPNGGHFVFLLLQC